jgi:hypothetical protein
LRPAFGVVRWATGRIFHESLDVRRIVRPVNSDNRGVPDTVVPAPKLTLVTTLCGGGSCPTVYRTDRGTLVVQGYTVTANDVNIDLPAGEQMVEIPMELLAAAVRAGE